jgi:CRP/FNR family cyclic AMP-dependent transcriptional regulator
MEQGQDYSDSILKFELFKGLEKESDALRELSQLMKLESFNLRDFIINERDSDTRMFFLLSGQVEVNKTDAKGQVIVIARTDAKSHPYFGESVLFGYFARSASVIAYSQCECLSLSAKDLEQFTNKYPIFVAQFYRHLSKIMFDRLNKATKDIFIARLELKK